MRTTGMAGGVATRSMSSGNNRSVNRSPTVWLEGQPVHRPIARPGADAEDHSAINADVTAEGGGDGQLHTSPTRAPTTDGGARAHASNVDHRNDLVRSPDTTFKPIEASSLQQQQDSTSNKEKQGQQTAAANRQKVPCVFAQTLSVPIVCR